MNLLDSASLVVTPNGYKVSKLYSIVPTSGTGDMTFSRAGNTATRVNPSGLIAVVNANIPRLDYLDSSCPKVLLEPQRTNLFQRSSEFDNDYWSKARGTVTANNTTSPDGTTNADSFSSSSGEPSLPTIFFRSLTFTGNTVYTVSIFAKKLGDSNNMNMDYVDNATGFTGGSISYNFLNATFAITQSPNSSVSGKMENYGNGWYRCIMTFTTIAVPTFFNIGFSPTTTSTGNTFGFYGAQLEVGAHATSYIPTTTASVTRNVDRYSKSNVYTNNYITSVGGTWFVDLENNNGFTRDSALIGMWIGESGGNSISSGFSSIHIRTLSGASPKLTIGFYNGTATTNLYQTTQVKAKIAITFNGTTVNIFVNGIKVVTNASVVITLANFQNFNFFEDVPINIKSTILFPTPLSDSNAISLTTL
jgi:hypothetical protein